MRSRRVGDHRRCSAYSSERDYYYRDRDDYRVPRAEFYHDRGLHRGWYNHDGDRTVIIKRHHHWDD